MLVGPIVVTPVRRTAKPVDMYALATGAPTGENNVVAHWSFRGFSRFDLALSGGLTKGGDIEVKAPSTFWSAPETLACMGLDADYNGPHPISDGSGEVVRASRVIEVAPIPPSARKRHG